jgi:hypothetical protein
MLAPAMMRKEPSAAVAISLKNRFRRAIFFVRVLKIVAMESANRTINSAHVLLLEARNDDRMLARALRDARFVATVLADSETDFVKQLLTSPATLRILGDGTQRRSYLQTKIACAR